MTGVARVRGLEAGKRIAVVVHEWQRGTVDPAFARIPGLAAHAESRGVTEHIRAVTSAARDSGFPVVWSTIEPRADRLGTAATCALLAGLRKGQIVAGSEAADLHPGLDPRPEDIRVRRVHGLTPFHGTELESYLRDLRTDTIVLCGVSVDVGVTGATLEAVNRGFSVVVPEDCTAGSSPEVHDFLVEHQLRLLATVSDSSSVVSAFTAVGLDRAMRSEA